jgi:hypothetical protein
MVCSGLLELSLECPVIAIVSTQRNDGRSNGRGIRGQQRQAQVRAHRGAAGQSVASGGGQSQARISHRKYPTGPRIGPDRSTPINTRQCGSANAPVEMPGSRSSMRAVRWRWPKRRAAPADSTTQSPTVRAERGRGPLQPRVSPASPCIILRTSRGRARRVESGVALHVDFVERGAVVLGREVTIHGSPLMTPNRRARFEATDRALYVLLRYSSGGRRPRSGASTSSRAAIERSASSVPTRVTS